MSSLLQSLGTCIQVWRRTKADHDAESLLSWVTHSEGGRAGAFLKRPHPRGRGNPGTKGLWGGVKRQSTEPGGGGWGVIREHLTTAIRPGARQRSPQGDTVGMLKVGARPGQVREPGSKSQRWYGPLEKSEAAEGGAGAQTVGGGRAKEESLPTHSDL